MSFVYEPEYHLAFHIQVTIEDWINGYEMYWGLGDNPPDEELSKEELFGIKFTDHLGLLLFKWARSLTLEESKRPHLPLIRDLVADFELQHSPEPSLTRQRLEIELGREFPDSLLEMTDRAFELLDFLVLCEGERTQAYLARVADCYIRGMPTEGVVMCRAVLEAALTERLERLNVSDVMIRKNVPNCGKHITLIHQMIFAKNHTNLLPDDDLDGDGLSTYKAATNVKDAGDNAVHTAPGLSDLKEVLAMLVRVLNRFYGEA